MEPSVRLAVVILLLQVSRASSGRADMQERSPLSTPQLIKHSSLTLHFQSKECLPSPEVEKTAVTAVWGAPSQKRESEEGESSIEGALARDTRLMKHNKPILLAGDPEDYVAELEELVMMLVFASTVESDRPAKALRLLSHLEDREKFFKYLKKDFTAFFPSAADKKAKDAATESKKENCEETLADTTSVSHIELKRDQEEVHGRGEEEGLFADLKACIGGLMDAKAQTDASHAPCGEGKRKKKEGMNCLLRTAPCQRPTKQNRRLWPEWS